MSPVDIYSFSALFSSQHVFSNPALKKQTNLQPVVCIFCLFVCFVSITHLQVVLWQHRFKYRYQYLKTQFSYSTEHKTLTLAHNFPFTIGTMCSVLSFGCKWFNVWFESSIRFSASQKLWCHFCFKGALTSFFPTRLWVTSPTHLSLWLLKSGKKSNTQMMQNQCSFMKFNE